VQGQRVFDTGVCTLFLKLESQEPRAGSIKDRIGRLDDRDGPSATAAWKPGGHRRRRGHCRQHTGLGLALVVARREGLSRGGSWCPTKMSSEKVLHLKGDGRRSAHQHALTSARATPDYYQDPRGGAGPARSPARFLRQPVRQTPTTPAPPHEEGTGPEIWEQMGHDVDAIVVWVSVSCGTLTGLNAILSAMPSLRFAFVLADPVGSILAEYTRSGVIGEGRVHGPFEGIGEDFVPPILRPVGRGARPPTRSPTKRASAPAA